MTSESPPPVYNHINPVNRSFVTDPAPEKVYQSIRVQWDDYNLNTPSPSIDYVLPVPRNDVTYTVRLHFAELYWAQMPGAQIFDIYVNGVPIHDNFEILAATYWTGFRAFIYEVPNVWPIGIQQPSIHVQLVPQAGSDGFYRAAINGIEIVKP